MPTYIPSRAPSVRPTPGPSEAAVDSFNCDLFGNPIQVMKRTDETFYKVRELDVNTGEYVQVAELDWFDGHINAISMYDAGDDVYVAYGAFSGFLCSFDFEGNICFNTELEYDKPNVGGIVGDNYYYTKDPGQDENMRMFWVEDLTDLDPTFHDDHTFTYSTEIFTDAFLDMAGITEEDDEYIEDGEDERSYLIGLGRGFEVVVTRLAEDGQPEAYAVLESDVDWGDAEQTAETTFGAAFVYLEEDGDQRFYAASNDGFGLFELKFPLTIDNNCWNDDNNVGNHEVCNSDTAQLNFVYESASAFSNDGMNCPNDGEVIDSAAFGTSAIVTLPGEAEDTPADTSSVEEEGSSRGAKRRSFGTLHFALFALAALAMLIGLYALRMARAPTAKPEARSTTDQLFLEGEEVLSRDVLASRIADTLLPKGFIDSIRPHGSATLSRLAFQQALDDATAEPPPASLEDSPPPTYESTSRLTPLRPDVADEEEEVTGLSVVDVDEATTVAAPLDEPRCPTYTATSRISSVLEQQNNSYV